ncbi:MAG: transcriptional repressor LexA [Candidatus Gracilibacteria bacterium]|jgi:repressor LexA
MIKNLTAKQQKVLSFYEQHIKEDGCAPTYQEAASFLNVSPSVVFTHVRNLDKKGYLVSSSKGRSVQILSDSQSVPMLGQVACGEPINIFEACDGFIDIPKSMLRGGGNFYALQAVGKSMINAGISDGDLLIVRKQDDASDGDIAVVAIGDDPNDESATLKKIYHKPNALILKPENDAFPTTVIHNGQIRGKLVGTIRNY